MSAFKSVFEAHPDVDTIYVCDGMPFLTKDHAESHAMTTKQKVEVVNRESNKAPKGKGKAKEEETSDEVE